MNETTETVEKTEMNFQELSGSPSECGSFYDAETVQRIETTKKTERNLPWLSVLVPPEFA